MAEKQNPMQQDSDSKKSSSPIPDSISIIYHQRNDSPKYFEISRRKIYLFFIGLPALALIGFFIGSIGLINAGPMHLIENYRRESRAIEQTNSREENSEKLEETLSENDVLKNEVNSLKAQLQVKSGQLPATEATSAAGAGSSEVKCPATSACPESSINAASNPINLSTLSLFKPIQGQKNRTRPASLGLTGFKTISMRDSINLQFNIIPTVGNDEKISGHIVVLMKNEFGISAYPAGAFGGNDFQINYSAGEPFATQRFRPVNASFIKPRRAGNFIFTVFIFSRTGDLIHYQTTSLAVKF